jgi:hypothetical protein
MHKARRYRLTTFCIFQTERQDVDAHLLEDLRALASGYILDNCVRGTTCWLRLFCSRVETSDNGSCAPRVPTLTSRSLTLAQQLRSLPTCSTLSTSVISPASASGSKQLKYKGCEARLRRRNFRRHPHALFKAHPNPKSRHSRLRNRDIVAFSKY